VSRDGNLVAQRALASQFGVLEAVIGSLFFGARLLNAVWHLGAAWLATRIGLVNTMVFTHNPSSLLHVTVAFAPRFSGILAGVDRVCMQRMITLCDLRDVLAKAR
jgi:hypothetical protein